MIHLISVYEHCGVIDPMHTLFMPLAFGAQISALIIR